MRTTKPQAPRMTQSALKTLPPAPAGLTYYVVGPFCWGRGETAVKAFHNARTNGGPGQYTLHLVNTEAEVDSVCGTLRYASQCPGVRVNIGTITSQSY